ncbi:hypothetical protein ABK040_006628 [Willaertia magna]
MSLLNGLPSELHLEILTFCNELDIIFVISRLSSYWYKLIKNNFSEIYTNKLSYYIQKYLLNVAKELNKTKITNEMIEILSNKSQKNVGVLKLILNTEMINNLLFYNVKQKPKIIIKEEKVAVNKSGFGGFLQKLFSNKKKEEPIIVNNNNEEYVFSDFEIMKLLLVGPKKTGKSTFLQLLESNVFVENYVPTIGVDFTIKRLILENELENNKRAFKLQVWDCARMDTYRISSAYYRGAHIFLFFFDICDRNSLDLLKYDFEVLPTVNAFGLLIGAKCDKENEREVSVKEAENVAKRIGIPYIELSSKTNYNVETILIYSLLAKYFFSSPEEIKFL